MNGLSRDDLFNWNSGLINTEVSFSKYTGNDKLLSHTKYYWQVKAFDKNGNTVISPVDSFETAKMNQNEWLGNWITDGHE